MVSQFDTTTLLQCHSVQASELHASSFAVHGSQAKWTSAGRVVATKRVPAFNDDSTRKKQRKFLKLKDAVKLISGKCTYLENEEIILMNVEETVYNCTWDVLGRCRWKKILSWRITECMIDAAPASEQWLKNFCCQRKTLALQKLLNALELQFHPGTWQKSSQHLVFEIVRKSQYLGSTENVAGFGNLM